MGRGVSSGGGQSSLGYLFGSGEAPKTTTSNNEAPKPITSNAEGPLNHGSITCNAEGPLNHGPVTSNGPASKTTNVAPPADVGSQVPAGINVNKVNNYHRADGQNNGNFITERPSTKVHSAPGGGSSLDYLFGGGGGK